MKNQVRYSELRRQPPKKQTLETHRAGKGNQPHTDGRKSGNVAKPFAQRGRLTWFLAGICYASAHSVPLWQCLRRPRLVILFLKS